MLLHPAKTSANTMTIKSESLLLHAWFGSAITTARIHAQNLLLPYIQEGSAIMIATNAISHFSWFLNHVLWEPNKLLQPLFATTHSSWLVHWLLREQYLLHIFFKMLSTHTNKIMREHMLKQPLFKHPSWLLIVLKSPFTSVKIAEYFVRENGR